MLPPPCSVEYCKWMPMDAKGAHVLTDYPHHNWYYISLRGRIVAIKNTVPKRFHCPILRHVVKLIFCHFYEQLLLINELTSGADQYENIANCISFGEL